MRVRNLDVIHLAFNFLLKMNKSLFVPGVDDDVVM